MARQAVVGVALVVASLWAVKSISAQANPPVGADPAAGDVRLVLPTTIYATPGIECNVYFDNIVLALDVKRFAFDVVCPVGLQFQERWTFTPTTADVGNHAITIEVRDEANVLVARGTSTVQIATAQASTKKPATLLIIGDSLTEYSVYPRHVLELSKRNGAPRLVFIGSRGAGNMPPIEDLRHEGYSGWTAEAFATLTGPLSRSGYHKRGATGSPFVYELEDGAAKLDFARYCREFNGGRGPDLVTICLGTNDVFTAKDDNIDETIDRVFVYLDALIESIHTAYSNTRVGVVVPTPPSTSQDGFRNYVGAGRQTRWQYRRNQHRLVERMLRHYENRLDQHVYLVPAYLNLDAAHHFPTWSPPISARSDETMVRVNNGTHPSESGYKQIGDTVYSWTINMLASAAE